MSTSTDVKSCGLCDKEVSGSKSLVKCSKCLCNFHPKCVNVNARGLHLRKEPWSCDSCNTKFELHMNKSTKLELEEAYPPNSDMYIVSLQFSEDSFYVLKSLLLEVRQSNKLLYDKVDLLEQQLKFKDELVAKAASQHPAYPPKAFTHSSRQEVPADEVQRQRSYSNTVRLTQTSNNKVASSNLPEADKEDIVNVVTTEEVSNTNSVNVPNDTSSPNWSTVRNRRQSKNKSPSKPKFLIGTANCDDKSFTAAKKIKKIDLHLTRVKPSASTEDITTHITKQLESRCINVKFDIIKLNSKHPEYYSSFKVTAEGEEVNCMYLNDFWPENVKFRKFYEHKSKISNTENLA